jgi:alkyl hydroperoxide reductase subunit AhpC
MSLVVGKPAPRFERKAVNNLSIDRSLDEAARVLQKCQHVRANGVACPADWRPGDDAINPDAYAARAYFASRQKRNELSSDRPPAAA